MSTIESITIRSARKLVGVPAGCRYPDFQVPNYKIDIQGLTPIRAKTIIECWAIWLLKKAYYPVPPVCLKCPLFDGSKVVENIVLH